MSKRQTITDDRGRDRADFSRRLAAARRAAGMAPMDVAARAGINHDVYYALESGRRPRAAWTYVRRLIEDAGLPLEHFFRPEVIAAAAARIGAGGTEDGS